MLDWLFDLLSGKTLVKFGFDCWNSLSGVAMTLSGGRDALECKYEPGYGYEDRRSFPV